MDISDQYIDCDNYYFTVDEFNSEFDHDHNNFFVFHQNIRSFDKNFDELSAFFSNIDRDIDVLILTETWFSDVFVSEIEGYKGYHTVRTGSRGGGVSVYVKESFKCCFNPEKSIVNEFIECCSVNIYGSHISEAPSLSIIGIYRPPSTPINLFTDFLCESLLNSTNGNPVLIGGDLNIDIIEPINPGVDLTATFNSFNFYSLISVPTRVANNSYSCIDHFWYNSFNVVKSGCFETSFSDHFTIFTVLKVACSKTLTNVAFRDHSMTNLEKLKIKIRSSLINFVSLDSNNDVDDVVGSFNNFLWEAYDECCPIRRKNISHSRLMKPWISGDLLCAINNKHRLFKLYKEGHINFNVYNSCKNNVTKMIKRAKIHYYRNTFLNCNNDMKKTWRSINSFMKGRRNRESIVLSDDGGSDVTDRKQISDMFCKFFSSIANEIDNDMPPAVTNPLDYLHEFNPQSFFIFPSTPLEVNSIIMKFVNKSCSVNNIPVFIYKFLSEELSIILSNFFNLSVSVGVFPQFLKLGRIIPIFKSKNHKVTNNYRPISLTHIISKIFEKLMCSRMQNFISRNNILSRNQFGFRQGLNTNDAILQLVDECILALDKRNYFITVLLDFKKAFDTVNHEILIKKLYRIGFRGTSLMWFRSFLTDRKIVVDVEGVISDARIVNIGLPQGSVISPLLFLLYINDMCNASNYVKFLHFADDTTVYAEGNNISDLANMLSDELVKIDRWLTANRLSLNLEKTCYLIFSHSVIQEEVVIKVRDHILSRANHATFLGVNLDDKLKFDIHINNLIKRLSRAIGAIYRISFYVPPNVLKTLYFSLFYSIMIYGITVWGASSVVNVNRIKALHVRILRILYSSYSKSQLSCNLMSFEQIYNYFCIIKFYKCIKLPHHSYFSQIFFNLAPDHNHRTRFLMDQQFNIPKFNKSLCHKFFTYQSIMNWNSLPIELRNVDNLILFKKKLKAFFLNS